MEKIVLFKKHEWFYLCFLGFLALSTIVTMVIVSINYISKNGITVKPSEVVVEDQTVCYSIGFDGWKRVGKRERVSIAELVAAGRVTVLEAQTLECIDYSTHPLKVFLRREQWWKRAKN